MKDKIVYLDIGNLLEQDFLTGIQRVVREVAVRLLQSPCLRLVPLRFDSKSFCFEQIAPQAFLQALASGCLPSHGQIRLAPQDLPSGSILYEIDAVWGNQPSRSWLYPLLRRQGIHIVTFIHDIIPITDPQYCYPNTVCQFMNYTGAVLNYAEAIFVSTQATAEAVRSLQRQTGSPAAPITVTGLGADFAAAAEQGAVSPDIVRQIGDKPYVLLVGTLEPRKNHRLLLDAFDLGLYEQGISLVFAGRIGWGVDTLCQRLESHPQLGHSLFHFRGLNDASIDYLYRHALVVAYPSCNEGFGLPIIEALERGVPVVASDIAVLQEVGQSFCLYCAPDAPKQWAELFSSLAANPQRMSQWRAKLTGYRAPTWDDATTRMATALRQLPG